MTTAIADEVSSRRRALREMLRGLRVQGEHGCGPVRTAIVFLNCFFSLGLRHPAVSETTERNRTARDVHECLDARYSRADTIS